MAIAILLNTKYGSAMQSLSATTCSRTPLRAFPINGQENHKQEKEQLRLAPFDGNVAVEYLGKYSLSG